MNFAVMGVAGYIAPRHLEAIKAVGGTLAAAVDPSDSVGILDRYNLATRYSRDVRGLYDAPLDWLVVCTPNHLHLEHCLIGLGLGANVICEKPLVLNPADMAILSQNEGETGRRIFTILQLRLHPAVIALKAELDPAHKYQVEVIYHTPRGCWYGKSWKGQRRLSGGLFFNIGIHLFDLLLWLFGPVRAYQVDEYRADYAAGSLTLTGADVTWSLSTDPNLQRQRGLIVDNYPLDLTRGFEDLHTESYRQILAGRGFGIADIQAGIELCHSLST